jgi:hypothetical protein
MMEDQKQKPDPKDDVNPKFTPDGGDCLADAIDEHVKQYHDGDESAVGSLANKHVPFKVK